LLLTLRWRLGALLLSLLLGLASRRLLTLARFWRRGGDAFFLLRLRSSAR
jgi:hypothetical protein